ncbi:hypothetical protein SAY87_021551 [Trapa incisa]|uniref:Uncharacterized protein n=1 Tax=Trapa incisa TaxID=236973 RepID=A0AAN7JX96_9MYRT|nr:hypothetical protein SAY87_021551 [Trapa incisa]
MKTGGRFRSRFIRIISTPIRVLCKARDLYVRSLSDYADRIGLGTVGCPVGHYTSLPRSFSAVPSRSSSGGDDLRELIRAASARTYGDRIDVEAVIGGNSGAVKRPSLGSRVLPKSSSVGMGRIDEDGPCDFGQGGGLPVTRSWSCAVAGTRGGQRVA